MSKLRVHNLSISVDGYAAGPDQTVKTPLGRGGEDLHQWLVGTPMWRELHGLDGEGERGAVDDLVARGDTGIGATIMGRNMYGPIRGEWGYETWRGWWGDDPPFHHPVFVLTHHAHEPIEMEGGTTFHFVTDGIEAALEQASAAAGEEDVRIGGGAATVQQYLRAQLVDELHIAISPVLLGAGERLFDHLDGGPHGLAVSELFAAGGAVHVVMTRS